MLHAVLHGLHHVLPACLLRVLLPNQASVHCAIEFLHVHAAHCRVSTVPAHVSARCPRYSRSSPSSCCCRESFLTCGSLCSLAITTGVNAAAQKIEQCPTGGRHSACCGRCLQLLIEQADQQQSQQTIGRSQAISWRLAPSNGSGSICSLAASLAGGVLCL